MRTLAELVDGKQQSLARGFDKSVSDNANSRRTLPSSTSSQQGLYLPTRLNFNGFRIMSADILTPEDSVQDFMTSPATEYQPSAKSKRVLACQVCQQRKVKCDRRFPCSNCIKHGVHCVPATLVPRQRRRRFAERELLDRLRYYEDLLQQNNIPFEPLHPAATPDSSVQQHDSHQSFPNDSPEASQSVNSLKEPEYFRAGEHGTAKSVAYRQAKSNIY